MAITITGGSAPFIISRRDGRSMSSAAHQVLGLTHLPMADIAAARN